MPWNNDDESSFEDSIALGDVQGVTRRSQTGKVASINAGVEIHVWDGFTVDGLLVYTPPTEDRIHDVVSDNANDTLGGAGMQKVLIGGVSNGRLDFEVVEMLGLTIVPTVKAYQHIHVMRGISLSIGASLFNDGTIRATAQTDGTLTCAILPTEKTSLHSFFYVPPKMTWVVREAIISLDRVGGAGVTGTLRLQRFNLGGVSIPGAPIQVFSDSGIQTFPIAVPAPFTGTSDDTGVFIGASFTPDASNVAAHTYLNGAVYPKRAVLVP